MAITHFDELQEALMPWSTLAVWLGEGPEMQFDAKVRRHGPSVLDPHVSYCVYHGPTTYTPYFILNLYELIAFCAHPRHGLAAITVTTRTHPWPQGFKMIPLPWDEVELAVVTTTRGQRHPLRITLDGMPYHTGIEGRPWW